MRIAYLEPVLIQRICLGLRKKREATVPVQQFINFDKEEQQLNPIKNSLKPILELNEKIK